MASTGITNGGIDFKYHVKKINTITRAVTFLKKGEVIAFPTETSYGLGCDPRDIKAVRRIYQLKDRPKDKALLLVASSLEQVKKIAEIKGKALELAKKYWPGPLTIILPLKKNHGLAKGVSLKERVAIRVSSSLLVRQLARGFTFPIVATSANKSGQPPLYDGKQVIKVFGHRVHFVINVGKLKKRKSSTLIQCHTDGQVEILRQGAIKL